MSKTSLPSVLLAVKEDALQRIIRDFLRGYGIQSVRAYSTANEAVNHLRAAPGKWDIFILDGAFPDAFEKVVEIRGELNSPVSGVFLPFCDLGHIRPMSGDVFLDMKDGFACWQ
jgi:CheY-like chemotaxis protein